VRGLRRSRNWLLGSNMALSCQLSLSLTPPEQGPWSPKLTVEAILMDPAKQRTELAKLGTELVCRARLLLFDLFKHASIVLAPLHASDQV
jgi:hypothetical protein